MSGYDEAMARATDPLVRRVGRRLHAYCPYPENVDAFEWQTIDACNVVDAGPDREAIRAGLADSAFPDFGSPRQFERLLDELAAMLR